MLDEVNSGSVENTVYLHARALRVLPYRVRGDRKVLFSYGSYTATTKFVAALSILRCQRSAWLQSAVKRASTLSSYMYLSFLISDISSAPNAMQYYIISYSPSDNNVKVVD